MNPDNKVEVIINNGEVAGQNNELKKAENQKKLEILGKIMNPNLGIPTNRKKSKETDKSIPRPTIFWY